MRDDRGMRLRIFTEPQQGASYATLRRIAKASAYFLLSRKETCSALAMSSGATSANERSEAPPHHDSTTSSTARAIFAKCDIDGSQSRVTIAENASGRPVVRTGHCLFHRWRSGAYSAAAALPCINGQAAAIALTMLW